MNRKQNENLQYGEQQSNKNRSTKPKTKIIVRAKKELLTKDNKINFKHFSLGNRKIKKEKANTTKKKAQKINNCLTSIGSKMEYLTTNYNIPIVMILHNHTEPDEEHMKLYCPKDHQSLFHQSVEELLQNYSNKDDPNGGLKMPLFQFFGSCLRRKPWPNVKKGEDKEESESDEEKGDDEEEEGDDEAKGEDDEEKRDDEEEGERSHADNIIQLDNNRDENSESLNNENSAVSQDNSERFASDETQRSHASKYKKDGERNCSEELHDEESSHNHPSNDQTVGENQLMTTANEDVRPTKEDLATENNYNNARSNKRKRQNAEDEDMECTSDNSKRRKIGMTEEDNEIRNTHCAEKSKINEGQEVCTDGFLELLELLERQENELGV